MRARRGERWLKADPTGPAWVRGMRLQAEKRSYMGPGPHRGCCVQWRGEASSRRYIRQSWLLSSDGGTTGWDVLGSRGGGWGRRTRFCARPGFRLRHQTEINLPGKGLEQQGGWGGRVAKKKKTGGSCLKWLFAASQLARREAGGVVSRPEQTRKNRVSNVRGVRYRTSVRHLRSLVKLAPLPTTDRGELSRHKTLSASRRAR
jgi:hypothetical protein